MKKKSFLEADSLLQRVESREILMLRACYDQRKKPAGGGRRVPVSEYVKSAESGDRLCEAAELPRSRILVQNAFGNAAGQFRLNLCNGRRCGILIASGQSSFHLLHIGANATDAVAVNLCTARVATDTLFRSEEHTSELQSLMRNSYAVFC